VSSIEWPTKHPKDTKEDEERLPDEEGFNLSSSFLRSLRSLRLNRIGLASVAICESGPRTGENEKEKE
jgi:hypothetical protein